MKSEIRLPLTLYPGRLTTALLLPASLVFVGIGVLMIRNGGWRRAAYSHFQND